MLMTSSRPKMMVRPSATSTTATPSASPVIICGASTNWRYSRNAVIRFTINFCLEPLAFVGADSFLAADIADDLEDAAGYTRDIHRLDCLVIAGAHGLLALRRHPFH